MQRQNPDVSVTPSNEEKPQKRFVFIIEILTAVGAGAITGILMAPFGWGIRKLQLNHEAKLTGENPPSQPTNPVNIGTQYSASNILKSATNSITSSAKVGATKNTIVSHREKISDLVNGEKSVEAVELKATVQEIVSGGEKSSEASELKMSSQEEQQNLEIEFQEAAEQGSIYSPSPEATLIPATSVTFIEQKKEKNTEKTSIFTQIVVPATITSGIDAICMNSLSNKSFWRNTKLIKQASASTHSQFHMPEITTFEQRMRAATTGVQWRFCKSWPSICGLLMQPYVQSYLPKQWSDKSKALATAGIIGLFTAPVITGIDNFHSMKLGTVKQNCSTDSMLKLLNQHGPQIFKPTPSTLAAGIAFQGSLQFIIPIADKTMRKVVVPFASQQFTKLSVWTDKHTGNMDPELTYRDDPCRTFGC